MGVGVSRSRGLGFKGLFFFSGFAQECNFTCIPPFAGEMEVAHCPRATGLRLELVGWVPSRDNWAGQRVSRVWLCSFGVLEFEVWGPV